MFSFSNTKAGFSTLGQDSEDDAERDRMLDRREYIEEKNGPRSWRFWSSNVPWMLTTFALSVYIVASAIYHRKINGVWSPTDLSN
jgi:hypothetical protein